MRKSEQQFLYFVHPRGVEKVRLSDRQTDKKADRRTHTHTNSQTHTHTQIVRQTNRQTDTD